MLLCATLGIIFHQNKFPVKFTGPNLFFPWLLVFHYLTDAFILVLFMSSTSHPHLLCRSSRSQMFFKIGVPKNFINFTGKHRCFPVKFAKFLITPFFIKHIYVYRLLLSILLFMNVSSFASPMLHFHYFLTVLLLSSFEEILLFFYHYYYIITIIIAE